MNNPTPQQILQRVFGFDSFRGGQQEIIDSLIAGQDNFVLMPTGGGKSLCFQIPAILREGVGIVVSPLISLMKDQVNALQANGVAAAFYNSSLGAAEARSVLARMHNNELDLLYVAPERLLKPDFIERLKGIDIALFAIDEAHCVSQWGHDFRPEYTQLAALRESFPDVPLIALTATADRPTRSDILRYLGLRKPHCYVGSFDRPNIQYHVLEKYKPLAQLINFLKKHPDESGIIYCISRKKTEEVAANLKEQGHSVMPYHAGLSVRERSDAQDAFQKDDIQIVVATIAFGMGIDKPNVRFVVHHDMPKHIENYYQETGRAGRDGLPSEALLLFGLADIAKQRFFIDKINNEKQKRIESHKLNIMISYADAQTCRRRALLNYFDENLEQDCGNCDICLNPSEVYNATVDAQKALSCIYRLNQRFGTAYVVDVLRGAAKQRILQFGHDRLSTYGIGKDLSEQQWFSILRQLIHQGFIEQDIANYSILRLTDKARLILRGETELFLAKPPLKEKAKAAKKKKKIKRQDIAAMDYDENLFEKLRQLRKRLADDANVPPFIVFGDASLIEMAAKKPTVDAEFLAINGVGEQKLKNYGQEFMRVIAKHNKKV
jgi:ATP-dependent DNA helicase RecQ